MYFLLIRDGFINHFPMKTAVASQPLGKFGMVT